jgi:putative holliday junction resolvase
MLRLAPAYGQCRRGGQAALRVVRLVLAPSAPPSFLSAMKAPNEKGRVLAIDPGTVRAGLALSDEERVLATPRATLDATDRLRLIAGIVELCRDEDVRRIVMGLPRHMTGELAAKAPAVLDLAKRLADATGLEVELVDERLTTVEAERRRPRQDARQSEQAKELHGDRRGGGSGPSSELARPTALRSRALSSSAV